MADSIRRNEPGVVAYISSFAVLIVIILFGVFGARWFVELFRAAPPPPAVVSLSAYFVDAEGDPLPASDERNGHLRIRGDVHQAGKKVTDGSVQLTVSKTDNSFLQTISTPLVDGHFESEDAALGSLLPKDQIHITVEVFSPNLKEPASEELYLNTAAPVAHGYAIFLWITASVLVFGVLPFAFLYAFTGRRSPGKNRLAIIFSYCLIGAFLTLPLLAPVLLFWAFPNVQRSMIGVPAGLVITRIPRDGLDGRIQWALNIGGYSRIVTPSPTPTPEPTASPSPTTSPAASPGRQTRAATPAPVPSRTASPLPTASPQPTQNVAATASPSPTQTVQARGTPSPTTAASPVAAQVASVEPESSFSVVDVEGGLVIPLYVIILSVIGGAINMTRKVPRFQAEGEFSEIIPRFASHKSLMQLPGSAMRAIRKGTGSGDTVPPHEPEPTPVTPPDSQSAANLPPGSEQPPPAAGMQPKSGEAEQKPQAKTEEKDEEPEEVSLNQQAKDVDTELKELVDKQIAHSGETRAVILKMRALVQTMQNIFGSRTDDDRILGFESFEDWLSNRMGLREALGSNWRVELLIQYMYLISAPFLAIVAYYMLDILGLTKQPILVLISFSVGLISEKILSWLLGLASGYLRSPSPAAKP